VAAASLTVFAGCSSDGDAPASSGTGPEVTADVAQESAEASAMLQTAFTDLSGAGYHFATVVTAGGGLAIQAEGDRVGSGMRFVVLRDEVRVDYIVTPDGTWVKPADGEWSAVDTQPATADPVVALGSATAVTLESTDGATTTLVATVPRTALGYEGAGTFDVTVTLTDGVIETVQYDSTVQGLAASVLTTVTGPQDGSPVVAPI
jgi:hypothetical protein